MSTSEGCNCCSTLGYQNIIESIRGDDSGGSRGGVATPPFKPAMNNYPMKNYCKVKMAEIRNTTAAVRANKRQGSIMTFLKRFV